MALLPRGDPTSAHNGGSSFNVVVARPGTLTGDQMVAVVFANAEGGLSPTITPPAGWTLDESALGGSGNSARLSIYRKTDGGSEPSSYAFAISAGGNNVRAGAVIRAFGGASSSPINVSTPASGSGSSVVAPSVSPDIDDCYLLTVHAHCKLGTLSTPAGMTELAEVTHPTGNVGSEFTLAVDELALGVAGATGAKTAALSGASGSEDLWLAFSIAVQPATNHLLAGAAALDFGGTADLGLGLSLAGGTDLAFAGSGLLNLDEVLAGETTFRFSGSGLLEGTPSPDFTAYDAYIDTGSEIVGLFFYDEQQPSTTSRRLQPVRQDVGNNPEEIRPDFGDIFAQNDFSHGMGQRYFHQAGRDPKRYFWAEGFNIAEPGKLRHLHTTDVAVASASIGAIAQAGGLPFVVDGQVVKRGNASFPGSWTSEDPSGSEAAADVLDLVSGGDLLYAALGAAGVHSRDSGGTWDHIQPDGATDLNIDPARRLAWVKDRLMVASDVALFEVAADSTPTAIETYAVGWTPEQIFEAGGFIHVCVVNADAGLSRVHHYGLNDTGDAIVKKSSTPWPIGELVYAGAGYLGIGLVGGGKANASGGYDPFLYRINGFSSLGEMQFDLVRLEEGSGADDLSVRRIVPVSRDTVLLSWSLGSGAFGDARDGLAAYNVALDAFSHHLRLVAAGGGNQVTAIAPFGGRILFAVLGTGLYFEDLSAFVSEAQLVTSAADWNNAGEKVWDRIELAHGALPQDTSIRVEYSTAVQEEATWRSGLVSSVDDSEGAVGSISNTRGRRLSLRLRSFSDGDAPEIASYSVRSNPTSDDPEWELTRYIRLLATDRRDPDGPTIEQDPRAIFAQLQDCIRRWVAFYESGFAWRAFVTDVSTIEPAQPLYDSRAGESVRDAFVVRISMTGTRSLV